MSVTVPNNETIDHPEYYKRNGLEAIDVIERHNLNFNLGSVVKYLWRMGLKYGESMEKDVSKAFWYVDREISRLYKAGATIQTAEAAVLDKLSEVFVLDCGMEEAYNVILKHLGRERT